jgi:hypothetical protein
MSTWICLPGMVWETGTVTGCGSASSNSKFWTTTNLIKKVFLVKTWHFHRCTVVRNPGEIMGVSAKFFWGGYLGFSENLGEALFALYYIFMLGQSGSFWSHKLMIKLSAITLSGFLCIWLPELRNPVLCIGRRRLLAGSPVWK